nr:unnamed protein product [Callosobruchus chinensis]
MREITFRTKAVRKVLQSLDINKATGPDMIPAVVAKKSAPELAPILTRLFRMSYSSGVFPKDWKLPLWSQNNCRGRRLLLLLPSHQRWVPQGSVLAPTLFLLHINDLLSSTTNPIHSFADDSTLHAGIMSNRPISVIELERRRLATAASLSKDLEAITAWELKNMVEFNASKTQYCTLSNKSCPSEHSSHEVLLTIQPSHTLYKAQIRPSLEYCSHIWGAAAPTTLSILDAVQRRAIRLIGDPAFTCHLQPLSHRRAGVQGLEWTAW